MKIDRKILITFMIAILELLYVTSFAQNEGPKVPFGGKGDATL